MKTNTKTKTKTKQKQIDTHIYFPKSQSSREVRDKLLSKCLELGVEVKYFWKITSLCQTKSGWLCKGIIYFIFIFVYFIINFLNLFCCWQKQTSLKFAGQYNEQDAEIEVVCL
jgi:hypothetical protein